MSKNNNYNFSYGYSGENQELVKALICHLILVHSYVVSNKDKEIAKWIGFVSVFLLAMSGYNIATTNWTTGLWLGLLDSTVFILWLIILRRSILTWNNLNAEQENTREKLDDLEARIAALGGLKPRYNLPA